MRDRSQQGETEVRRSEFDHLEYSVAGEVNSLNATFNFYNDVHGNFMHSPAPPPSELFQWAQDKRGATTIQNGYAHTESDTIVHVQK